MSIGLLFLVSLPTSAMAQERSRSKFVRSVDRLMARLAPQNTRASKAIKQAYRDHLDLLVLDEFEDLEAALWNGGLAPLPHDTLRFNVTPRLEGPSPIGEKDLPNQVSYIAARPATIGALLEVASRVKSGPIEVTSLVRHTEYQGALRRSNPNATTAVPMHTMGLAFDISLVNAPLETVSEIRDVLISMREAGEILFIGERRQLVFHVVPHPKRLGHFHDVYAGALGYRPVADRAQVVALSNRSGASASVSAEVIAVLPTADYVEEWWSSDHEHTDITIEVVAEPAKADTDTVIATTEVTLPRGALLLIAASGLALVTTWRRMSRPSPTCALLRSA